MCFTCFSSPFLFILHLLPRFCVSFSLSSFFVSSVCFFFACSEWHLRKSKILHKHRTNESNTSKEEKREILILCNDELFIKYKSMSMATLCHKHIFTANTSWCMMYEVRQKKRQRTHTHTHSTILSCMWFPACQFVMKIISKKMESVKIFHIDEVEESHGNQVKWKRRNNYSENRVVHTSIDGILYCCLVQYDSGKLAWAHNKQHIFTIWENQAYRKMAIKKSAANEKLDQLNVRWWCKTQDDDNDDEKSE